LRGASAIEELLKQEKSVNLTILVVWEPILSSDWGRPTRPVLGRISDPRVKQFWDKDHLIAKQLNQQLSTSQPSCCRHAGILWDGGSQPVFIDGAVVQVETQLAMGVSAVAH
jgi:hypothetical protein